MNWPKEPETQGGKKPELSPRTQKAGALLPMDEDCRPKERPMWRDCRQQGRALGTSWTGNRAQGGHAQAQFPPGTISGIPEPPTFQASCLICIPHPLLPAVLENIFTSSRKPFLKQNQGFFQCLWPASTPAYIWRILIYYIYPRVPYSLLPEFKLWVLPGPLKPQYSDCSQCICV